MQRPSQLRFEMDAGAIGKSGRYFSLPEGVAGRSRDCLLPRKP
jgi:hypothetical protein